MPWGEVTRPSFRQYHTRLPTKSGHKIFLRQLASRVINRITLLTVSQSTMFYKTIASVLIGAAAAVALDGKHASSDTFAALVATINTNEEGREGEALQELAKRIDEYENQVTTALAAVETYGEGSGMEPPRELAKRTDENKDGAKNGVRGAGSVIVSVATSHFTYACDLVVFQPRLTQSILAHFHRQQADNLVRVFELTCLYRG